MAGREMTPRFNRTPGKTRNARRLQGTLTEAEVKLWMKVRGGQLAGYQFRRQHPAGPYMLDFFCSAIRLAVELDGDQHGHVAQQAHDRERDAWLAANGVTVLRFWNLDVLQNLDGVLEAIRLAADGLRQSGATPIRRWHDGSDASDPSPTLPLQGREPGGIEFTSPGKGEVGPRSGPGGGSFQRSDASDPSPTLPLQGREVGAATIGEGMI